MAVLAEAPEPPPEFADRVLGLIPVGHPAAPGTPDPWRFAWGLVPAFAAMVVGLFLVYQTSLDPNVSGLLPIDDLSSSEHLVFGTAAPQPDLVLAAVLEGDAP